MHGNTSLPLNSCPRGLFLTEVSKWPLALHTLFLRDSECDSSAFRTLLVKPLQCPDPMGFPPGRLSRTTPFFFFVAEYRCVIIFLLFFALRVVTFCCSPSLPRCRKIPISPTVLIYLFLFLSSTFPACTPVVCLEEPAPKGFVNRFFFSHRPYTLSRLPIVYAPQIFLDTLFSRQPSGPLFLKSDGCALHPAHSPFPL